MGYIYILLSLVMLFPLYFLLKKLFLANDDNKRLLAIGVMLIIAAIQFYIYNFDYIPLLDVYTGGDDVLHYLTLIVAYLPCVPYMIAGWVCDK